MTYPLISLYQIWSWANYGFWNEWDAERVEVKFYDKYLLFSPNMKSYSVIISGYHTILNWKPSTQWLYQRPIPTPVFPWSVFSQFWWLERNDFNILKW